MMRIFRRESSDRPIEIGGYKGTKSAFADCARPSSRFGGRVEADRIRDDARSMEIGG